MALQTFEPLPFFRFLILYTVDSFPFTGDQTVIRPLSIHRTTQKLKDIEIHASSGIQTHDPSVRAGEDGSCLKLRGNCDQLWVY
jgi:hypothetical protein